MKKQYIILLVLIFSTISSWSQKYSTSTRINSIKNRVEILKAEVPGLEEKLNVNISNTSLANFLLAVSKIHKVNINVDQQLNSINIVNGFTDVNVGDLLVFLAKEYNLEIDFIGNILSIKPYAKPEVPIKEKEIEVLYNVNNDQLSLNLNEDPLDKVFRKVMTVSGRNLLYSPSLKSKKLSAFINGVSFETAIDKLSLSNGLEFEKTEDGFFIFNTIESEIQDRNNRSGAKGSNASSRIRPKRKKASFFYEILDQENKILKLDVKDISIADLVYTLAEEFNLDVFLASPLENSGQTTFKSERIKFDNLLTKVFENTGSGSSSKGGSASASDRFTFKKENNLYFFGTEGQLTLNRIEFIPLQYRSVELLGDASNGGGSTSRLSNSFNNGGGLNFVGNGNSFSNQGRGLQNNNRLNNGANTNSFNNNNQFNGNNRLGNNNNNSFSDRGSRSSQSNTQGLGAITSLFPDTVLEGLDVKMDVELNGFIVSGPGVRVQKFKNFVSYVDKPVPVILLEVMILEVSKNATIDAGLELGVGAEDTQSRGVAFPNTNGRVSGSTFDRIVNNRDFQKIIGGFKGFSSLNLGRLGSRFYVDLRAEETNGNIKILSTPKLSTLNGHKAYLSSGETTYYQVVNQNFIGTQNPQTSEITNFSPIDAELAIEFKPFVAGNGQITLDIQVIQSSFGDRISEAAPPDISSRRFSSILRMHENDVAILGGLEEKRKSDRGSGVPLLSKIPILKWLFSRRSRTDSKSKLNILIKPTVFY